MFYVDVVAHLNRLRNAPLFAGKTQVIIDGTSLGRVVSDMLRGQKWTINAQLFDLRNADKPDSDVIELTDRFAF